MTISTQTTLEKLQDLQAFLLALRPDLSVSLDTDEGARLQALAEALAGIDVLISEIEKDIYPMTASATALELHAEVRLGPGAKKSATKSSGVDALRVSGTVGATVTAGDTLAHTDGTRYQLTEGGTVGGGGTVDVSIESISTGTSVNKLSGESLSFESPPAGITTEAVLVVSLSGGLDEETSDELRVRVLDAYRSPPAGGRFSDYRQWATSITGVAASYVYGPSSADADGRRGLGVVDVAVLVPGTGAARIPGSTLLQEVQDYLDDMRPATTIDVLVLAPGSDDQDVDVQITPATGYDWDWTGSGVVSSYAAGTKRITWGGALSATLMAAVDAYKAGTSAAPRICVAGQVLSVIDYDNSGPYTTDVSETPSPEPANPDPIYPGGPVSQPVLDAIVDLFDALGPARGTAADPEQEWDDTLRLAALYDAVMDVTGVKDAVVVTPATNITPTDHAHPGVPDLLVPGDLIVRPV